MNENLIQCIDLTKDYGTGPVLEHLDLNLASGKLSAGMITQREYNTAARALQNAQFSARSAELTLFTAMENYDWAVKGLAAAD